MTIMYRTGWVRKGIEEIEVIRETKCFFVVNENGIERKIGKDSGWGKFHLTFNDAKSFLIKEARDAIDSAYQSIERNTKIIYELNKLTDQVKQ